MQQYNKARIMKQNSPLYPRNRAADNNNKSVLIKIIK